jgi:hypothetical protein
MEKATEYKGIPYSIPRNSDGVWTWIIHPSKSRRKPPAQNHPKPTYATRAEAATAAENAIDVFLAGKHGKPA